MLDGTLDSIIQKMENELNQLKSKSLDVLLFSETAAGICQLALDEIRKLVIKNGFETDEEEICFFKNSKPKVLSNYVKLFEIASHRFNASEKFQIKYLNHFLKELHKYLDTNTQFCQYYWSKKTNLDKFYFLREKRQLQNFGE